MIHRNSVAAVRWALLIVAALAVVAAAHVASGRNRAGHESAERYLCPMHPEVTASAPGECPICRMALESVARARDQAFRSASMQASKPDDASQMTGYVVRPVVFTDNVRAPARVESPGLLVAHLYLDEVASLEPGARGVFSPAAAPAAHADATLTADPPSPWDCCTSSVRLRLDARAPPFERGATGWLRFAPKLRHATLIPWSSVLQSPDGAYVLASAPDRPTWEPRPVRLGKFFFGHAVVLSGLREKESVAVDGLFFLDAERRLRQRRGTAGANPDFAR